MVHASSINCSDTVRQAVIARFHSTKYGLALLSDDGGVAREGGMDAHGTLLVGKPQRLPVFTGG